MEKEKLRDYLRTSDILLADLDGVIADAIKNSLKAVTYKSVKNMPKDFKDSCKLFASCTKLLTKKLIHKPDEELLNYCIENVLEGQNPEMLKVDPKKTIYPKVEEFFNEINPYMTKILITRNFCEIASAYSNLLEFNELYCNKLLTKKGKIIGSELIIMDENDKYKAAKEAIDNYQPSKAIVMIDTKEDLGMVNAAKETIDTLVIGVNPKNGTAEYCDIIIPKDWSQLYEIIK